MPTTPRSTAAKQPPLRPARPWAGPAVLRGWLLVMLFTACGSEQPVAKTFSVTIEVVGETGMPVRGATISMAGRSLVTDAHGHSFWNQVQGPEMAIVTANGYLAEPLPLGWRDDGDIVQVALIGDRGGKRFAMHFGGDAMFGRRYESPLSGTPLIPVDDAAQGAARVVRHIAPVFSLANFRALNLETVLSTRPLTDAYPGKRFLLRSHPDTTSALNSLQVDMVGFSNNHTRDFMDEGIVDTLMALSAAGIPQAGGGDSFENASAPLIQRVSGLRVGTLAYTTVTGTFVNNNYPSAQAQPSSMLAEKDAWLYEPRAVPKGVLDLGGAPRRIGTLWRAYAEAESTLSEAERAEAWASMVAVFPELQDWVARRGHGGAAQFTMSKSPEQISALKDKCDLLIVQLHAGFQFQEAASESVRKTARAAIDAGADVVIGHHPHVLQGFEWYKGRLIAYSLGNFIFDQDFLSTFQSGFLRLIWDETELVQARFLPLEIVGYQPMPITDQAARRTLRTVWERGIVPAMSRRSSVDGSVVASAWTKAPEQTTAAQLVFEHHTARILRTAQTETTTVALAAGQIARLDDSHLQPARLGLDHRSDGGVEIGRDLFGWGHFEDNFADSSTDLFGHWARGHRDKQVATSDTAEGNGLLQLRRSSSNRSDITVRPVARIPLRAHRLWDQHEPPAPLDPPATYSLQFLARAHGMAEASVRMDLYHFDDQDPTKDPSSALLKRVELPLGDLSDTFELKSISIDDREITGTDETNMVMFYLMLAPPAAGEATLEVDELAFIEWRSAQDMPAGVYGSFTHVRNEGPPRTLSFEALSAAGRTASQIR